MKVGIFDSGIGGEAVRNAINKAIPDLDILYLQDSENLPYGNKTNQQLKSLVIPFIERFLSENCEVIVIACNTLTTNVIAYIRDIAGSTPVIGIEPMVKPAAAITTTNIIAVCATPATLKSRRYKELVDLYASELTVVQPDCSNWSAMIEAKEIDKQRIEEQIRSVCKQGADVIVLGCTHYHWIEEEVKLVADTFGATVVQPEDAIVAQLERILKQLV